jgi:hypothetical protein
MLILLTTFLACDDGSAPGASEPEAVAVNPEATPEAEPGATPEAEPGATPGATPGAAGGDPSPTLTNTVGGGGGALRDLAANLQKGLCSNGPGAEGADSYFVGKFQVQNNQVSGTETWVLYANPKWTAKGGLDCSVTWNITGSQSPGGGACGTCDSTLSFQAVADVHGSQCPEDLVLGRLLPNGQRAGGEAQNFAQSYGIERRPDGPARVYFGRSGKLLGEGYHDSTGITYASSHSCKWF